MKIFRKSDLNGFFALFADNLANMVIMTAVCLYVINVPKEIVFGRILPGLGVALLVGLGWYARAAIKLAEKENRDDVTALPYGISTPVMFIYLFGVMLPAASVFGDGTKAWQVGIAACFLGGIIEAAGSVFGPLLKRVTPRAGMLGTLAGIALVYIACVPLAMIFEKPLIGFPALVIVFIGLIAAVRMPGGMPAGLVAILVGSAIGLFTGDAKFTLEDTGFFPPLPWIGDLIAGMKLLASHPEFLAVIIPIEIYNFIETMNNVESAEAAGDAYDVRSCQIVDGLGTMTGAIFGACFPTTVYIGHPAYKRLGAGPGYALMVGLVFFLGSLFGLVGFLHHAIPHEAVAPLLVFVGVVITAQAFHACPAAHAPAVAIALVPHAASILVLQMNGTVNALKRFYGETLAATGDVAGAAQGLAATLTAASSQLDGELTGRLLTEGIHYRGETLLAQGAIVTGLLWGGMTAALIDRDFRTAGGLALGGAILHGVGVIHAAQLGFQKTEILAAYLLMAVIFYGAGALGLKRDETIQDMF